MAEVIDRICDIIASVRFNFSSERELQDGIAMALAHAGVTFIREHHLGTKDRIDFYIPDGKVGIEVKTKSHSSPSGTASQCLRYCHSDKIDCLVLATSRLRLDLPETLNNKPVRVVQIWVNAL